jgi:hypothetical protein
MKPAQQRACLPPAEARREANSTLALGMKALRSWEPNPGSDSVRRGVASLAKSLPGIVAVFARTSQHEDRRGCEARCRCRDFILRRDSCGS